MSDTELNARFDDDAFFSIYDFVMGFYGQAGFESYRDVTRFGTREGYSYYSHPYNYSSEYDGLCLDLKSIHTWCALMHQVSHLCAHQIIYRICFSRFIRKGHYILREAKHISWIEELISEACAIRFLEYARDNWDKCRLSESNPGYSVSIADYYENLVSLMGAMKNVRTCWNHSHMRYLHHWSWYRGGIPFYDRGLYASEVLDLAGLFDVSFLPGLFRYPEYADFDKHLLKADAYSAAYPGNKMIEYMCELQERIRE